MPAAATAPASVGNAPFTSFGALAGASTASLKALTGVIRAFFDALIRIASPVAGVAAHACRAVNLDELGEAGDGHRLTLGDDGGHDIGESVHHGHDRLQLDIGLDGDCSC